MNLCRLQLAIAHVALYASSLLAQTANIGPLEWKSTTGESVVATLVDSDSKAKTITLERQDGKRAVVSVLKLTEASRNQARKQSAALRQAKSVMGVWYWRCPAPHERNWWITTTLSRVGNAYRLDEESTGHSETKNQKSSYFYKRVGRVYIPIDERNGGEKQAPFTIDAKGDLIMYYRKIIASDRVIVEGGGFMEIYYAKKDDAEAWLRDGEKFPPIDVELPIYVNPE